MSDDSHDHADSDMFGVVALVAKIFGHVVRMAGRHGIDVDEAKIESTVNGILQREDC
jgi:hypothetical protein